MRPEHEQAIARMAGDRESGASDLLQAAIRVLTAALHDGDAVIEVARAVCAAQPAMAPMWNVAAQAIAARHDPERFDRFVQQVARAEAAMCRFALGVFADEHAPRLDLVTISASRAVAAVITAVAQQRPVAVALSEGRPALEGRAFAARLTAGGIPVHLYGDAAIADALDSATALIVGADAVAAEWFVNKSGTRMLAAAAMLAGVPVYVAATREKFVAAPLRDRLQLRDGAAEEIWRDAPAGVTVRNPYFERIPIDMVSAVITDAGVLGAGMVPEVCASLETPELREAMGEL